MRHRPQVQRDALRIADQHRLVGRVWVVAMYWTVLSSLFIQQLSPTAVVPPATVEHAPGAAR